MKLSDIILEEDVDEGIVKNLTIAALVGLAAAAGIPKTAQAQLFNRAKDSGSKIVNVVQNANQTEFNSIQEFQKHFKSNVEKYSDLSKKPLKEREFYIMVDNAPYVGYVGNGPSVSSQMAINKAKHVRSVLANNQSGQVFQYTAQASNGQNIAVVLYKVAQL